MPKIAVITTQPNHNLQTLLEAQQEDNLKDGEITLVVSAAESSLRLARKSGVDALQVEEGAYDAAVADKLAAYKPDLIVTLDSPHRFGPHPRLDRRRYDHR